MIIIPKKMMILMKIRMIMIQIMRTVILIVMIMVQMMMYTSFFSRVHSWIILSPCSWKVMMMRATKMLTKKKGKTTK